MQVDDIGLEPLGELAELADRAHLHADAAPAPVADTEELDVVRHALAKIRRRLWANAISDRCCVSAFCGTCCQSHDNLQQSPAKGFSNVQHTKSGHPCHAGNVTEGFWNVRRFP
jgi:hypothetical protein